MISYTTRLANAAEVTALPEIERAAAQRFWPYLAWLDISSRLLEGLTTSDFLLQAQADDLLWVSIVNTQPVGFIVAKLLSQSCFIVELDVHPDYGRQGIGSSLVEACCQGAQARGFERVTLTTFRKVPWNIPFYRRLGFEVLPPERWSAEIKAIVRHEAHYGFAKEKRAVMCRLMRLASSGSPL